MELSIAVSIPNVDFIAGPGSVLSVSPEDELSVVNGTAPTFRLQVLDVAGNPTTLEARQSVVCKVKRKASSVGGSVIASFILKCSHIKCWMPLAT